MVIGFGQEDLRSHPFRCAFYFLRVITFLKELGRQPEVSYFNFSLGAKHDIKRFQVSVNLTVFVHVVNSNEDLLAEICNDRFRDFRWYDLDHGA